MPGVYLTIVLAPLIAAIVIGLLGHIIGRTASHWLAILGVGLACVLSFWVFKYHVIDGAPIYDAPLYIWGEVAGITFQVGFLVDTLTALMIMVVTFVSLMVHIYTVGYMQGDPGYQRFFCYIALFTFSMLMLVMSNNFLQLFFGWEAVGVVSYLLIGFWFKKDTAVFANLKAFIVNRVGDFGFILGLAAILAYCGSFTYSEVFANVPALADSGMTLPIAGVEWSVITVICILLFIGAMGKSAQVPLHVWLPDSMEGPTPISALIHAATMVTAGVFMVARMSPIFEYSDMALNFVIIIGGVTALFMGLVGIVQNDIKRIIAYSTLSQLGYMMVAVGISAYAAGIFHLFTHAFFKALLFLGAGSVIIAMHHDQDIRNMGNLRKYMPITYVCMLIGSLALIGFPFFSGYYSKDAIIEAAHASTAWAAPFGYWTVLLGVLVTSLYTFRLLFVVFHGKERMRDELRRDLREPRAVVWVPLILLAIPSAIVGGFFIGPMLFDSHTILGQSLFVLPKNDVLFQLAPHYHGAIEFAIHGLTGLPFWFGVAGIVITWLFYVRYPAVPAKIQSHMKWIYHVLINKYGFDEFNQAVFARGGRGLGYALWQFGDVKIIDGALVNGSAHFVGRCALILRRLQSGYLYHYALMMLLGLLVFLLWFTLLR